MTLTFAAGFTLGLSLILAIGAQNAFILRQGLRREHVLVLVLICAGSDALLIVLGVGGFSALSGAAPWIEPLFGYGGAAFLIWYGALSLRRAWIGGEALLPSSNQAVSLRSAVMTCLALTWLNPHVYLDTVGLIGAVSTKFASPNHLIFGAGAVTASFVFFFGLGYGARLLAPIMTSARAWRILDVIIGIVMLALAGKLLFS